MKETRKDKVLRLLRDAKAGYRRHGYGEYVPTHIIESKEWGGTQGTRRLRELRGEGHEIEAVRKGNTGTWLYRLKPAAKQLSLAL